MRSGSGLPEGNGETPVYSGGDGTSQENPVIINLADPIESARAQHEWVENRYGVRDVDWSFINLQYADVDDGKQSLMEFTLKDGRAVSIWFDISQVDIGLLF